MLGVCCTSKTIPDALEFHCVNIKIINDDTTVLRIVDIAKHVNRKSRHIKLLVSSETVLIPGDVIKCPETYSSFKSGVKKMTSGTDLVLHFTEKPYDNNYFWDAPGGKYVILSLFGWDRLTKLSRNNGAVYFLCAILVRMLGIGDGHRVRNTGCINDFWQDKTGIDTGMRCAFVCPNCLATLAEPETSTTTKTYREITGILDSLSSASRSGIDICDYWSTSDQTSEFDVFMCHNSDDKIQVREMNHALNAKGIKTWLDEEQLPPGRSWQELLEEQIQTIKSAAIFVGPSGMGPWHNVEIRAFLQEFVRRKCPVIPVILKSCKTVPQLPFFINQLTWVDFRKDTPDPFGQLLWGITGKKPK